MATATAAATVAVAGIENPHERYAQINMLLRQLNFDRLGRQQQGLDPHTAAGAAAGAL